MNLISKIILATAVAWIFGKLWYWSMTGFLVYKLYLTYVFDGNMEAGDTAEFVTMLVCTLGLAWLAVWSGERVWRKLAK